MRFLLLLISIITLIPFSGTAQACACGCGVFSVGTSALLPNGADNDAYLEYDYLDQTENWSGGSSAPAADNSDKDIRTDFYTLGLQHMFNRDWSAAVEVPYWDRLFVTTQANGGIGGFHDESLGDIRVMGMYTGFSADLSSGLEFGLKLATGDYTDPHFDRDTSIGTGTTDLLLGAYHEADLNAANTWTGFVQAHYEWALSSHAGYRPGNELDAAGGVYYSGWQFGQTGTVAPVLQLLISDRWRDSGPEANPPNSGYQRLLAAPGIELDAGGFRVYADVEVPLYQHVNGDQLVAARQYKLLLSYSF